MSAILKRSLLAVSVTCALAAAGTAHATNGYFAHGYGTTIKGMAGAGVALSQDALAAATNPAGMVTLGDRIDAGAALFSPRRQYSATQSQIPMGMGQPVPPGTAKSGSDYFLIPHFGWNRMLDSVSSVGISIYGNGGMNTNYDRPIFGMNDTGIDLNQLFIAPTYSRMIGNDISVGITPILAYQRFKATGLEGFGIMDPGSDDSWGYGLRIGVQGEVAPGLRLGASYQTKISMDDFDKYSGLFAEQGGFDIPSNVTVGLAWDTSDRSTLVFDIQNIRYSDVNAVGNPLLPNFMTAGLGADDGPGFGWRNMTIAKLGYQWQTSNDWTWRVGYSYGKQPIPDSEVLFNILAPGVMEQHVTFGFTHNLSRTSELNFAGMYAPSKTVSGTNPFAPDQTIELKMHQFELEFSYAWKF